MRKCLYKCPQAAYPYADLVQTNGRRSRDGFGAELLDTGVFDDDQYFDVFVEAAKGEADDILVKITAVNRGPDAADLHLPADAVVPERLVGMDCRIQPLARKPNLRRSRRRRACARWR